MSDVTILIQNSKNVEGEYDFTYQPATIHVKQGKTLTFEIDKKGVVPDSAWLVFGTQVVKPSFYLQVSAARATEATFGDKGAQHYQFVGVKGGKLVADMQCPSVIVH